MVGGDDHLVIETTSHSLGLAYAELCDVYGLISLDFTQSPKYGYLTSCPSQAGLGLEIKVRLTGCKKSLGEMRGVQAVQVGSGVWEITSRGKMGAKQMTELVYDRMLDALNNSFN